MITRVIKYLSVVIPLLLLGCSQTPLRPLTINPDSHPGNPESSHSVEATMEGVNVIIQSNAWAGATDIRPQVTPLRLTITNNSGRPLRLRYGDMALIAPDGEHFAALPPFEMAGLLSSPGLAERYTPIFTPGFTHFNFLLAPPYEHLYERMDVYKGAFFYDPLYYDRYYSYWETTTLPTREMLELAIPEGVLLQGGEVEGFIYFEHALNGITDVHFRLQLVDASTGYVFGEITAPINRQVPH